MSLFFLAHCVVTDVLQKYGPAWTPPVQKLGGPDPSTPRGCAYEWL